MVINPRAQYKARNQNPTFDVQIFHIPRLGNIIIDTALVDGANSVLMARLPSEQYLGNGTKTPITIDGT